MRKKLLSNVVLLLTMLFVGVGSAWADEVTGTIIFGKNNVTISTANVTADDDQGNSWNIVTIGTTSFTANAAYYQVGSSSKPATSITFTCTLPESVNVKSVKANFGGFSGTAGSIDVKVGDTSVGSGSLNATNDVAVESTSEATGDKIVITITNIAKGVKAYNISYTYESGGSSTELEDNDLTLTGAPIALNFDLYSNKTAQTISYTTSSTGEVSVEAGNVSCYVDQDAQTITVTPMAVTNGSQTVTINQAADDTYKAGSVTFTVTITDSTPIETHTATFSVNGVTSSEEFEEGADIVFPANPADVSGKTFVGWTAAAINGTTSEAPSFVKNATMGDSDVTFYAVFAFASGSGSAEVTDVLNRELTGVTGTSYSNWSGKTVTSSAVYAGNSAGGNESIQLRSNNNNSGIITTTSGGMVTKVAITWNSNTADGRTVNVYGSDVAYSAATDLYGSNTQGTLLGTIVCGTSTELDVTDDYEYVGLRSAGSAMYLDKVEITWSAGGGVSYSDYCTTVVAAAVERPAIAVAENPFVFSTTATITCATEGATIYYSYDNTNWTEYTQALNITATTTIYTKAVKGNDESSVAEVIATKNLAAPTVAIDATGITNTDLYVGTDAGSLSATVTYNDAAVEGATVTWSGNNDAVATINATTGAVTLVAAGSVTFTATYAGTADYSEKTGTYVMTVTNGDPNVPGTENNPYTVAEARAAIDAGTGITGVYAKGIVSEIVTAYNSQYGNISYNISADGTTTADQLQAYRGKGIDGANFTSEDDIQVGDEVVIYGNLTKYGSTYEFAQNNQLVSLDRPVVTTPIINANDVTIEYDATSGEIAYTIDNPVDGTNLQATTAANWISNIVVSADKVTFTAAANDGTTDREATITLTYGETTKDITVTQKHFVVDYATLPFEWDSKTAPEGITISGTATYNSSPYLKFDGTGDFVVLKINEAPGALTFDIKGNSFSDGTFTVQTSVDGETYSDLATYTELGATQSELFNLNSDVRYIKWIYTEKVNGNVALGNIKLSAPIKVTVGAAGWTSFVPTQNVTFSKELTAYIVTASDENTVTLTSVQAVKAATPVLVEAAQGEYLLEVVADAACDDVTENLLKASDGTVQGGEGIFALGMNNNEVGFYMVDANATVPDGKAYLQATGNAAKAFVFGETAIQKVEVARENGAIYNMAGQRVNKAVKGLYIQNGRKFIVK